MTRLTQLRHFNRNPLQKIQENHKDHNHPDKAQGQVKVASLMQGSPVAVAIQIIRLSPVIHISAQQLQR